MAATGATSTRAPLERDGAGSSDDWVAQSADTIERVVVTVRSKTTEPIERLARVVVYGLLAAIVGTAALVILGVTLVRVLDIVLPADVWAAYAVLGGISTLAGLFMWRKRSGGKRDQHDEKK